MDKLDLNEASADEIAEKSPMIGRARADSIVTYREEHGAFENMHDVQKVPGFSGKLVESLDLHFFVGEKKPARK